MPPAKEFVDIVLSRTQRKTPTVVHPGYKITRVRSFYMRKVKYCQSTYNDKLNHILEQFPRIDDIHPFYADLCNVLYDRDHYKIALGQVNAVKNIISSVGKDYVKLMKFSDSQYKCKMLKRAALGRMCTAIKKCQSSLTYLEEVRQHLARLPTINPATRTLILTGYPNVGKSSFMNTVTQANVDVQPYAFTTKSLFVGHMDYEYCRWQVIDTPGILDHPLEDRNTIEMTAITALAHISCAVLFFVDISESCGYNLDQQVALFHQIKPLFKDKPLLVLLNKTDLKKVEELTSDEMALLNSMKEDADLNVDFFPVSNVTKDGIDEARTKACDLLLQKRVGAKVNSSKAEGVKNRIHVTKVNARTDRPPSIPESVLKKRAEQEAMAASSKNAMDDEDDEDFPSAGKQKNKAAGTSNRKKTEKDLQDEMGGAGVYSVDLRKSFLLRNPDWKYDNPPEIFEGQNIADFIDPDIEKKLKALEKEEELLLKAEGLLDDDKVLKEWRETQSVLDDLHSRMRQRRLENKLNKSRNKVKVPRRARKRIEEAETALAQAGFDEEKVEEIRGRSRSVKRVLGKRAREASAAEEADPGTLSRGRSRMRDRSLGLATAEARQKAEKVRRKMQKRSTSTAKKAFAFAAKGEGDRHIPDMKPKHLYSGKRGIGKTDRR